MIKKLTTVIIISVILFVYRAWFSPSVLSSGDWIYYFPNVIERLQPVLSWDWRHNGMGGSEMHQLWLESYFTTTVKVAQFIPWQVYERVFWFFPFLLFGFFSSIYAAKQLLGDTYNAYLAALIYVTNTYALLLVGGGQMGIGLAYAFFPFVFTYYWKLIQNIHHNERSNFIGEAISGGGLFSLLIFFDIRIAFLCTALIFLLAITYVNLKKQYFFNLVFVFLITGFIILLIHSFWMLPMILHKISVGETLTNIYTNVRSLSFFSFAKLEQSFSLLHPNWPENLFGKTYFMKSEFLFLPLLAFGALLSTKQKNKHNPFPKTIIMLAFIGLLGSFLAKGVNEPFGELYAWLFQNIPGFIMFRDPTKFYIFIAFSYALLIPFTLNSIAEYLAESKIFSKYKTEVITSSIIVCFVIFWIFLSRQASFSQLSGTFTPHNFPEEYRELNDRLNHDTEFFRILWVPKINRFGMFASEHPSLSADDFLQAYTPKKLHKMLENSIKNERLQQSSIRYIIVPYDNQKEIFLNDRKYDEEIYANYKDIVTQLPDVKLIKNIGKLAIFELSGTLSRFTIENKNIQLISEELNPTEHVVSLKNVKKGDRIVFSESYSKNWKLVTDEGVQVNSERYKHSLNSYVIPKSGNYTINVVYTPQKDVIRFLPLSFITLLSVSLFSGYRWLQMRKRAKITI